MCVCVCFTVTHLPLTFFSHSPITLAWTSLWHSGIISRHALTGSAPSPVCCCCVGCLCLCLRKNKRDWGTGDFCASLSLCSVFQIRTVSELITYPQLILIQLSYLLSSQLQQKAFINKSNNWMSELGREEKLQRFRELRLSCLNGFCILSYDSLLYYLFALMSRFRAAQRRSGSISTWGSKPCPKCVDVNVKYCLFHWFSWHFLLISSAFGIVPVVLYFYEYMYLSIDIPK